MGKISVQRNQGDTVEREHVKPEHKQVLTFNFQITRNTGESGAS